MTIDRPKPSRITPARAALAACAAAAIFAGCSGSPIDRDGERSQFSRHEALRGNYARAYVEDDFGRMIPNLRARLLTKE